LLQAGPGLLEGLRRQLDALAVAVQIRRGQEPFQTL
jgi:hypothetical protein